MTSIVGGEDSFYVYGLTRDHIRMHEFVDVNTGTKNEFSFQNTETCQYSRSEIFCFN